MLLSLPIHLVHHRSTVEPLSLRCCTDIATLSLCCRAAITPLSHRFRAVVEPRSLRPKEGINNSILNCCCSTVTPLSLMQGVHTQCQCKIGTDFFSRVCSTDSISCSEQKNWKKKRLKQGSKTKEGKSKHFCRCQFIWLIIALLLNLYNSAITPLSLRYRFAITA